LKRLEGLVINVGSLINTVAFVVIIKNRLCHGNRTIAKLNDERFALGILLFYH